MNYFMAIYTDSIMAVAWLLAIFPLWPNVSALAKWYHFHSYTAVVWILFVAFSMDTCCRDWCNLLSPIDLYSDVGVRGEAVLV